MKFSGKMCLMIILKVTKNQGFNLCLENTVFKKPQAGGGGMGGQIDPYPSPAVLGLNSLFSSFAKFPPIIHLLSSLRYLFTYT